MGVARRNPFTRKLYRFLADLEQNNRREWFQSHKSRYEDEVVEPALEFVSTVGRELRKISPQISGIPTRTGGSLFRIYRDTRFSKDKRPYKTYVGIRFPHAKHRDVHAPGYYLHLERTGSFFGFGAWHPEPGTLKAFRDAIVADPAGWKRTTRSAAFRRRFELGGESLKTAPKGFDREHPLIEDIRRKDFIGFRRLPQKEVLAADFPDRFVAMAKAGAPFLRWLCKAIGAPF